MRRSLCCLVAIGLLAGCGDGGEDEDATRERTAVERPPRPAPTQEDREETRHRPLDFDRVETVAGNLQVPWALAFADSDTILVTERPGRVRVVKDGKLRGRPVAEVDAVAQGEGGLLGIALHPEFPDTRLAYLYYTAEDGNRLSRFRVAGNLRFRGEEVLLTIPAGPVHDGGRIAFGPGGLLYAGTGETGSPNLAADRDSLAGKLLRVTPQGEPPDGNPFGGSPVFSWGHRNVQGLDWDEEGALYASEHGPSGGGGLCCHDEVNLIKKGRFYGWPFFAGEARAQSGDPPARPVEPLAESGAETTWAPAGLAVHEPRGGPKALLVANLAGEQLLRFVVRGKDKPTVADPQAAIDGFGRLRAATFGPKGCLYLTTSNTDGRGAPSPDDDRILRVCPR